MLDTAHLWQKRPTALPRRQEGHSPVPCCRPRPQPRTPRRSSSRCQTVPSFRNPREGATSRNRPPPPSQSHMRRSHRSLRFQSSDPGGTARLGHWTQPRAPSSAARRMPPPSVHRSWPPAPTRQSGSNTNDSYPFDRRRQSPWPVTWRPRRRLAERGPGLFDLDQRRF